MMPCLFHQKKSKKKFGKKGRASFQLVKKKQGVTKKGEGAALCKNGLGRTLMSTSEPAMILMPLRVAAGGDKIQLTPYCYWFPLGLCVFISVIELRPWPHYL